MRKTAAFLLVIAILAGARRRGRLVLVDRVALCRVRPTTPTCTADTSMISPKIDGYIQAGPRPDNQSVAAGEVMFVHRRPRFRGKDGAGRGGGRDRRSDRRDLCQPPRFAAGDDRAGRGGGDRAEVDLERARSTGADTPPLSRAISPAGSASRPPRRMRARRQAALDKTRAALVAERNQLAVLQSQKARGRGAAGAGPREPRSGAQRSRQHGDPRAVRRRRRQPRRPGRAIRQTRDAARRAGAAAARLCDRELQGNAADPHAAGPAGRDRRRRLSRSSTSPARSRALRRPAARSSACCRRTTRPATSPRSCSACRCASRCRQTRRWSGCCAPGSRSR